MKRKFVVIKAEERPPKRPATNLVLNTRLESGYELPIRIFEAIIGNYCFDIAMNNPPFHYDPPGAPTTFDMEAFERAEKIKKHNLFRFCNDLADLYPLFFVNYRMYMRYHDTVAFDVCRSRHILWKSWKLLIDFSRMENSFYKPKHGLTCPFKRHLVEGFEECKRIYLDSDMKEQENVMRFYEKVMEEMAGKK